MTDTFANGRTVRNHVKGDWRDTRKFWAERRVR